MTAESFKKRLEATAMWFDSRPLRKPSTGQECNDKSF